MGLATANAAVKDLSEAGLIEGARLTPRGMTALKPYAVDNAVILAAGLSSRFAPISYERPKGLLKVRGEVSSSAKLNSCTRRESSTSSWSSATRKSPSTISRTSTA